MPSLHEDAEGPKELELRALTNDDDNDENDGEFSNSDEEASRKSSATSLSTTISPLQLQLARRWLYGTHGVAQFSEVAWQFSLAFFLSAITNHESLFWVSCYGVSMKAAVSLGSPMAGHWMDNSKAKISRWQVIQRIMSVEAICVALASVSAVVLLLKQEQHDDLDSIHVHIPSIVTLNMFGSLAQVCDQILIVAFERDWIVEMSYIADEGTWLTSTNIAMRQIDLSAKVLGPTLAAFVLPFLANSADREGRADWSRAACIIGSINMMALLLQFVGSSIIYHLVPQLGRKEASIQDETEQQRLSSPHLFHGLHVYLSLPIMGAGLALALLYLNGLTFGNGILTAHLLHRGMHLEQIGIFRGLAAVFGLAGTWIFHKFRRFHISLKWTALWSLLYEFVCLLLAAISLIVSSDDNSDILSVSLLVVGVLASRTGLWVFDLAVTQLQQENVPDKSRGIVGGIQQALNSIFGLICFAIGLVYPQNFDVYVWAAFSSVGLALGFYLYTFRMLV